MANYSKVTLIVFSFLLLLVIIHSEEQSEKSLVRAARQKRFFWPGIFWLTQPPQIFPTPATTQRTRPTRTIRTTRTTRGTTKTSVTTRRTSASSGVSSTTTSATGFTTFQNQALSQTNTYRAAHCAPPLKLNASLNAIAQAYANKLAASKSFQHSNNGYGENLYMFSSSRPINAASANGADAVNSWYDEVNYYSWSSPGFSSGTGHFTQLVWISSQQLGTGIACSFDQTSCYVVANYWPPGNYQGQYEKNVKPKSSC